MSVVSHSSPIVNFNFTHLSVLFDLALITYIPRKAFRVISKLRYYSDYKISINNIIYFKLCISY